MCSLAAVVVVPLLTAAPAAAASPKPDPCQGNHVPVYNNGTNENHHYVCGPLKGEPGNPGADGKDGKDGKDGVDGKDGTIGIPGLSGVGKNGVDGINGKNGSRGLRGPAGADGVSKTVIVRQGGTTPLPKTGGNAATLPIAAAGVGLFAVGSVLLYRGRATR